MTLWTWVAIGWAVVVVAGSIWLEHAGRRAPVATEDETGFHATEEKELKSNEVSYELYD